LLKAAGCPIVTELDEEQNISNCYRISPTGRLEIEAVVPTTVFEAFSRVVTFLPPVTVPAVTDPVEVPTRSISFRRSSNC
jgi:hypothetical protein